MKRLLQSAALAAAVILAVSLAVGAVEKKPVVAGPAPSAPAKPDGCVECHRKQSPALVMEWERSRHAGMGIGCAECHAAKEGDPGSWVHHGKRISVLVTPKACGECHKEEAEQFGRSHHAKAGEILASLDNVLADKMAGMPGNNADAVNGCWQCHGGIVKFKKDGKGNILRAGKENQPVIDPTTWPNSGVGRINPDGSKGTCHSCHSRHSFDAKLARAPENCGKCHMGPDHPQIEIYNESKHGIAFHANRDKMALDKEGDWVLGKDYSAAPTCATCHMGAHMTPAGKVAANNHDVGERISWTLRPVVSAKLNLVTFEDGFKEDYPETRALPKVGETVPTTEKVLVNEKLENRTVPRKVAKILTWQERREKMGAMCRNCHEGSFVKNFYSQYDSLVVLYNEKFAKPAQELINALQADGALNPKAPFQHELQWVFYELWHHEGRRARHGASMMGPDYTHWHGMYEVGKHFYTKFLPAVVEVAAAKSPELRARYEKRVKELLSKEEHLWLKGLKAEEAEALRKEYRSRYNQ